MRKFALIACLLALGACTSPFTGGTSQLQTLVRSDALNARQLALNADDTLAVMCWDYLLAKSEGDITLPPVEGAEFKLALTAYQFARNVRRRVDTEVSDEFRINCGPMLIESAGALGRLGIRIVSPL